MCVCVCVYIYIYMCVCVCVCTFIVHTIAVIGNGHCHRSSDIRSGGNDVILKRLKNLRVVTMFKKKQLSSK